MLLNKTIVSTQYLKPYLEFSGACAGCGETPYAKLVTQLFGDKMYVANATGCSSIWGGSAPSTPYTVDKNGNGPAWSNSLFEDNAEFGLGMFLANAQIRARLAEDALALKDSAVAEEVKAYLDTFEDTRAMMLLQRLLLLLLKKQIFQVMRRQQLKTSLRIRIMLLRRASGSSAATAGLMISVSAVLTMFLLRIRM